MSASAFDIPDPETDLSEAEQHIRQWIAGKREDTDTPHRDPDVIMHYYWDREMSQSEVGEKFGVSQTTVNRWLKRHDLGTRDRTDTEGWTTRVERGAFDPANKDGHERWIVNNPDGTTPTVGVHQLLAVADGADPADVWADNTHVHHKTDIPWLNMPGTVEVLTRGEHKRTHTEAEWTTEDGIPVLKTQE